MFFYLKKLIDTIVITYIISRIISIHFQLLGSGLSLQYFYFF